MFQTIPIISENGLDVFTKSSRPFFKSVRPIASQRKHKHKLSLLSIINNNRQHARNQEKSALVAFHYSLKDKY